MDAVGVGCGLDELNGAPARDYGRIVDAMMRRVLGRPDFVVPLSDYLLGALVQHRPGCLVVVHVFSRSGL